MINNDIPKHWKIVELKDVVSILGDGLHGTPKYSEKGEYFFINGNNLCNGKIIIKEDTKRVSVDEFNKYRKTLNENTILVSINGTIGNVALYINEKVILGKSACYFNVLKTIDKNFLRILISSRQFLNYAEKTATGSTIKNVSLKAMREFNIPLPPLPEQLAIISRIEELLSDLENGKQQLLSSQQQLKIYRQSLLKWAFEGKLTNKVVKDGELPKGWKWVKLSEITSVLGDGLHGTPNYSEDGDYFFINGNNLTDGRIEIKENTKRVTFSEFEKYKKPLNENTILVSINGSIGYTAFYNGEKVILGKSACYFNVLKSIDKKYLRFCLLSQRFLNFANKNATGSTIKNVGLKTMRDFEIPLPSLSEQQLIVDELESKLTVCDKIEETISQSLLQAESLRQSILKKAFEGKLVHF